MRRFRNEEANHPLKRLVVLNRGSRLQPVLLIRPSGRPCQIPPRLR